MSQQQANRLLFVMLLIGFGLVARLLPHPPNFVPIAAISLFGGFVLRSRLMAVAIPIVAMLTGDLLIGTYDYRVMAVVYAALALPVLLAQLPRRRPTLPALATATIASSLVFFATTNFAVWYFGSLYSHDLPGLVECYVAAVPFFKFTLAGDLVWALLLFGSYGLSQTSLAIKVRALAYQPAVRGR
jgi:hypothetical protein